MSGLLYGQDLSTVAHECRIDVTSLLRYGIGYVSTYHFANQGRGSYAGLAPIQYAHQRCIISSRHTVITSP
jgi:hypothetical protein